MKTILWVLKWFLSEEVKAEKAALLSESKQILEDCKEKSTIQYINFDRVDLNSEAFLHGMGQFNKDANVLSWLLHKRLGCEDIEAQALRQGNDNVVARAAAQVGLVKGMIQDLNDFDKKLTLLISKKKAEKPDNSK